VKNAVAEIPALSKRQTSFNVSAVVSLKENRDMYTVYCIL
jgi:hypothetical protein